MKTYNNLPDCTCPHCQDELYIEDYSLIQENDDCECPTCHKIFYFINVEKTIFATAVTEEPKSESTDKMKSFIESLLNPEENGYAVPLFIRDEARRALGLPAVES